MSVSSLFHPLPFTSLLSFICFLVNFFCKPPLSLPVVCSLSVPRFFLWVFSIIFSGHLPFNSCFLPLPLCVFLRVTEHYCVSCCHFRYVLSYTKKPQRPSHTGMSVGNSVSQESWVIRLKLSPHFSHNAML